MLKIGLLSDTHGFMDERFLSHLKEADEIWHAGDIGERGILAQLSTYPPLKAVSRVTDKKLELLYPILILRIASAAFYLFTAQLLYPILRKAEAPCLF